jgi:hypothetical protein
MASDQKRPSPTYGTHTAIMSPSLNMAAPICLALLIDGQSLPAVESLPAVQDYQPPKVYRLFRLPVIKSLPAMQVCQPPKVYRLFMGFNCNNLH